MKLRLFTILIVLTLPMVLIGTIGGQTTAMMAAEVVSGTTTRVSVASDGTQGNSYSERPSVSFEGHYVAFAPEQLFETGVEYIRTTLHYDAFADRLTTLIG